MSFLKTFYLPDSLFSKFIGHPLINLLYLVCSLKVFINIKPQLRQKKLYVSQN
jgi:hypothetical protein